MISIRNLMSKLLVHRGPGRPRIEPPVLRKQFEHTGQVSFQRDRPDLYLMQQIRRDVTGKFNIYLIHNCVVTLVSFYLVYRDVLLP